jgi:crotonobetainyl-CoA:carnitine CoA-transferase CaiB-like acyl-CoA transferase
MQLTPTVEPRAAPRLGEHTLAILRDRLGHTEQEIESLRRAGTFGQDDAAVHA